MIFRITLLSLFLLFAPSVFAAQCLDVFPSASQTYGPELTLPSFKNSSSVDGSLYGSNLAIPVGNYVNVEVSKNGVGTFTTSNAEYRLKKLTVEKNATIQFVAGDYWIDQLRLEKNATLAVVGSGTVRIYADSLLQFSLNTRVNQAEGNLIVIGYDDAELNKNADFTGVLYVHDRLSLDKNVSILGSATAKTLNASQGVITTYQESLITESDFNGMCDNTPKVTEPLANYRFDECEYTGTGFEVVDQTGNYSATSHGGVNTFEFGQIERGAEVSDEDHHFETSIVLPNDFSVSTWFKKPTSSSDSPYFVLGAMSAGGDLLYIDRTNNWRWGVYDGNGSSNGSYSFSSLDNNWHHLTLVYSGGQTKLYIDGTLADTINRVPSGTLKYVGTSFDDVNSSNPQGFRVPLDEFMVFDGVLTTSDITTIYNNQLANKNYDGTVRDPVQCSLLLANYHMDELTWNGSSGEVYNELGTLHGTAFNGLTTDGVSPARAGNPGTCRYGSFDGIDDYVEVADDPALDLPTELSITTWIMPESIPSSGLKTILSKDENYEFHVNSSGEIFWWWGSNSFSTSGAGITAGNWYHVAITYKSGKQSIYVNSVEKGSRTFTGNLPLNNDPLQIGQDQGYAGRYFHGLIDEVSIYSNALSATDVNDIYLKTHPCTSFIDHYEISHDGQGLTCQPENITIKACADATCSTLNMDTMIVQLSINGTANKFVTIAGGTTDTSFAYTSVGTAALSLDQAYQCKNGASTSCDVEFAEAGFVLDINGVNDVASCDDSKSLFIKAVKLSDDGVSCAPAFVGDQPLNLEFKYQNPVTGTKVPLLVGSAMAASGVSQPRVITFNGDGEATLPIQYDDAGQLSFTVSENISSGVSPATLTKDFYPSKLVVTTPLSSTDSDGTVTQKAGLDFPINVIAQCQIGTPTENYKPQSSNVLQLSVQQKEPVANNGVLKIGSVNMDATNLATTTWGSVNQAAVNFNGNYSEVGIINLAAQDTNYLGNLINSAGYNTAGRFIPDRFEVNITKNSFADTCTTGTTDFTYIGQPFSYLNPPELLITAKNAAGVTTENYTEGNYQKLAFDDVNRTFPNIDTSKDGLDLTDNSIDDPPKMAILPNVGSDSSMLVSLNSGVMHYTFKLTDSFTYIKNANSQVDPFPMVYDIVIDSIQDSDGVDASISLAANNKVSPSGVNLRFGRWFLENTFGPETSDLSLPMAIQYWNGSHFVTNTLDNCTDFTAANLTVNNINITPGTSIPSGSGFFVNGATQELVLSAPGTPHQGSVPISYTIPLSMPWLKYDWNWDGVSPKVYTDNPTATATFGQFRGNDRIIYQREVNH